MKTIIIAALFFISVLCQYVLAQNTVTLVNQSKEVALVKMVGPVTKNVEVATGSYGSAYLPDGVYLLKLRLGGPAKYQYAEGPPVRMEHSEVVRAVTKITLPQSIVADSDWRTISSNDFSSTSGDVTKNNPQTDKLLLLVTAAAKSPGNRGTSTAIAAFTDQLGGLLGISVAVTCIDDRKDRIQAIDQLTALLANKTGKATLTQYDITVCKNAMFALSVFDDLLPDVRSKLLPYATNPTKEISESATRMVANVDKKLATVKVGH